MIFCNLPGKKEKEGAKGTKDFFAKNWARLKLPHYEEKKSKFIIIKNISVPISCQIRGGSRKF